MYVAAVRFADLKDNKRLYEAGEKFPRDGLSVTAERIQELAGSNNRMGYPLIKQAAEATTDVQDALNEAPAQIPSPAPKAAKKPRRKRDSDA